MHLLFINANTSGEQETKKMSELLHVILKFLKRKTISVIAIKDL